MSEKRLLIITQKIDIDDPVLGFFHNWIYEFAKNFSGIVAICLERGDYNLPNNVKVLSLGKEKQKSRLKYLILFYKYIWQERKNYDSVFVHMNQEYILLSGLIWKILGKKIYMWRNHHSGSLLTDIASIFCDKVFCTSKYSYTAKYKKTILMPVGVNANFFKVMPTVERKPQSVLFLGRIAPSKNVDIFIETLGVLKKENIIFSADIYGDALPKDGDYLEKLKKRASELYLDEFLKFNIGVPNTKTPEVYNAHEIFINLSSSGMYDKTIFEAMACGCLTLVSNENLRGNIDNKMILDDRKVEEVYKKLSNLFLENGLEKKRLIEQNVDFARTQSLDALMLSLKQNIK
ncbi:MAG: glycosyltransferase [Parcubacteria group bacterium]|nr:glycosyltransferase [Parcubacteria group bacterium]